MKQETSFVKMESYVLVVGDMPNLKNRSDAFVGDSEADGGEFYTPQCYTCKNKIDVHTCTVYLKGIPVNIILGEQKCKDFLPS